MSRIEHGYYGRVIGKPGENFRTTLNIKHGRNGKVSAETAGQLG